MTVVSISSLTVRYGARIALDGIDLEIPEGCIGLLGPNGAGKTTLIKTLLGFVRPASGICSVLGKNCVNESLAIRQHIGLMPELDCHIPGINAVTFVAYAGELAGMPASYAMGRAHEVLEYCGLGEARYRNVETYSTGMLQRIKLAQALVHGPELVFLDEPTNGLDPVGRDEMLALIRDISRGKGVNVIVSSHLLPDVEKVCDRIIVMQGGHVATEGTVEDLQKADSGLMDVELRETNAAFAHCLAQKGVQVLHTEGSRLQVSFPADTVAGKMLFEAAKESGVQIRGFKSARRSLEEVFLNTVERNGKA